MAPPGDIDGIPSDLAPESRRIFEGMATLGLLAAAASSPADVRRLAAAERPLMGAPPPVSEVETRTLEARSGTIRLRVYRPAGEPERALLWMHGGGWVIGDLEHCDIDCRHLCLDTNSLVAAVEYRLAPEHPFPAGLEDAYDALLWLAAEVAGRPPAIPIVVGGDSAGGNLAAALCMLARDRGGPAIGHQVLLYPVGDDDFERDSYRRFGEHYVLTAETMKAFWRWYLGEGPDDLDLVAIVRARDVARLPPATFVIAGCDVLRDEAEAYANRLQAAGISTEVLHYPGQLHGFWSYPGVAGLTSTVNAEILRSLRASSGRVL